MIITHYEAMGCDLPSNNYIVNYIDIHFLAPLGNWFHEGKHRK